MSKVIIMGMMFDEGSAPDFGSIFRTHERHDNTHEYGLNSADVSKLDLITNAAPGATALCVDTGDIYVLTKTEWAKFGEGAQSPMANVNRLDISMPSFDRTALDEPDVMPDGEMS